MTKRYKLLLITSIALLSATSHVTNAFASEVEPNSISEITPLAQSKKVRVYRKFMRAHYPTRYDIPQNIWYNDGIYKGYIYLSEWGEEKDSYHAYYSGYVLKGPYVPTKINLAE